MKQVSMVIIHLEVIFIVLLIFTRIMSPIYLSFYTMCVLTNCLDRMITRMFPESHTEEKMKVELATSCIATFTLLFKMLLYLFLNITELGIVMMIIIGFLKTTAGFISIARFRHHVTLNTVLFKITVILMLALPYTILIAGVKIAFGAVCVFGCLSGIEEFICILIMKNDNPNIKSVITLLKN